MVDTYIEAGYNYFDTSFVYHNGKSEEAVRKALIDLDGVFCNLSGMSTLEQMRDITSAPYSALSR